MKIFLNHVAAIFRKKTTRLALAAALAGVAAAASVQAQSKPTPPPVQAPPPVHAPPERGHGPVVVTHPGRPVIGIHPIVECRPVRPVIEVPVCAPVRPVVVVEPVIERRWIAACFEERKTHIWIEPVYRTIPGEKFFVEPVYRTIPGEKFFVEPVYKTVVDRVWREPVIREEKIKTIIPAVWIEREVVDNCHCHPVRIEKVLIPARYEVKCQKVVVCAAHFDEIGRQELVCAGRWERRPDQTVLVTAGRWESRPDQTVLVCAGHYETRCERVCVTPAHWETPVCVR